MAQYPAPNVEGDSPLLPPDTAEIRLASQEIVDALLTNVVRFYFYRVTYGTARWANGTLDQSRFVYTFKGGTRPYEPGLIAYWDFMRRDWRSFYITNVRDWEILGDGQQRLTPATVIDDDDDGPRQEPTYPVRWPANVGIAPVDKRGRPEVPWKARDGVRDGLHTYVDDGFVHWRMGSFVKSGAMYQVPTGGFLPLPPAVFGPKYVVLATDYPGTPYLIPGVDNGPIPNVGTGIPIAVIRIIPYAPGKRLATIIETNPPDYNGI